MLFGVIYVPGIRVYPERCKHTVQYTGTRDRNNPYRDVQQSSTYRKDALPFLVSEYPKIVTYRFHFVWLQPVRILLYTWKAHG